MSTPRCIEGTQKAPFLRKDRSYGGIAGLAAIALSLALIVYACFLQ